MSTFVVLNEALVLVQFLDLHRSQMVVPDIASVDAFDNRNGVQLDQRGMEDRENACYAETENRVGNEHVDNLLHVYSDVIG
ncbi:MAG: hypothetical protein IV104_17525 [Acidovorax sp.]|nr:hypothetical protein [Acidovorax sp.]